MRRIEAKSKEGIGKYRKTFHTNWLNIIWDKFFLYSHRLLPHKEERMVFSISSFSLLFTSLKWRYNRLTDPQSNNSQICRAIVRTRNWNSNKCHFHKHTQQKQHIERTLHISSLYTIDTLGFGFEYFWC